MIVVANKRKKEETLKREYPGCIIIDVTSNSKSEFVKFSPFYPHGGIPVPGMKRTAASVEGIWQGLKTFESGEGIDTACFDNRTMKNLKRTVRTHGRPAGHRYGDQLLGYLDARRKIYLPAYQWVLENKLGQLARKLKAMSQTSTVVLLDYETNGDVNDPTKPLSHASLVKAYVDNLSEGEEVPIESNADVFGGKQPEDNQIFYKTADGKIAELNCKEREYNKIISHRYDTFGEITFESPLDYLEYIFVRTKITNVKLPNSVTEIEWGAFSFCDNLQQITIPDSVEIIGNRAFDGCSSLRQVTIPNSVTMIDWGAFKGCSSLQQVTIPNSVTMIDWGALLAVQNYNQSLFPTLS